MVLSLEATGLGSIDVHVSFLWENVRPGTPFATHTVYSTYLQHDTSVSLLLLSKSELGSVWQFDGCVLSSQGSTHHLLALFRLCEYVLN